MQRFHDPSNPLRGNVYLLSPRKQSVYCIQLLQDEIGNGPGAPGPPGGRHKPIAATYCAERWIPGAGEIASIASERNISFRKRASSPLMTCCLTTWQTGRVLDVIRPVLQGSYWSCRAAVTASSRSMVCTQCPGARVNNRADSGAPTYSRNRGWRSCSP